MALNSKTVIKLVDLICEGPIEGIVGKRDGVFLNETPATSKDLRKVDFEERLGTLRQPMLSDRSGFATTTTSIINVEQQVGENYSETPDANNVVNPDDRKYGVGKVIQQVNDPEADYVQLIFTIPRLFSTAVEGLARGQLFPAKIRLEIKIAEEGQGFVDVSDNLESQIIEGIATSAYQFKTSPIDLECELGGKRPPWRIKVKKLNFRSVTGDREDAFEIKTSDLVELPSTTPLADGRADTIVWNSIIVGKYVKTNYSGTAIAALSLDAEEYSSLPSRSYEVKGRKLAIPHNSCAGIDGALIYNDNIPFNGSLKTNKEWTTCPVCCFYDMLINKRYGAGNFINADNVSWVDLIEISKYCNQQIDLGNGQTEPRFAINTAISTQADAYSVIQDLASVFRGIVYWRSNTVQLAADHGNLDGTTLDAIHIFSNSNVVEGGFSYSGSSLKTRSTRVVARYNDPNNFYKPDHIIVEDRAAIDKYGLQTREIVAFGCTSRTQAQRMAKWVLTSEQLEGETVSFAVGLEGLNVLPGQIFAVSDAMRQGSRLSGRIIGATRKKIIADQNVSSLPGSNDEITVRLPDGRVQTRSATLDGSNTIIVSTKFDDPPEDGAIWSITDSSVANQKFRCLAVAEGEDGVYAVTGVIHNDSIYSVVESANSQLIFPDVTLFDDRPSTPTNLKIQFYEITRNANKFKRINVSWSRGTDNRAINYEVQYKISGSGNFKSITTINTSVDIDQSILVGQKIVIRVFAIGPEPNRLRSKPAKANDVAPPDGVERDESGATTQTLPPDPTGVTLEPVGTDQVLVGWDSKIDGQNLRDFTAIIRHSGNVDGTGVWYKSVFLRRRGAHHGSALCPLLEGEYFVKFENREKLKSNVAASAVINLPDILPKFNFESINEAANGFPGQRDGVYFDDSFDGLVLDGDASFDHEVTSLDGLSANIDTIFGTQRTTGTYYFGSLIDFGNGSSSDGFKFSPLFKRILDATGIYRTNTFDDRVDLCDTWSDFDGDIADDVDVQLYLRSSNDIPTDNAIGLQDADALTGEDGFIFGTASNITYGDWVPLENTSFTGRHFQFKAVLTTTQSDQSPVCESLGVDIKFETRTETSDVIRSGLGTRTVTFKNAFYTDADTDCSVGIIAYDMEPGDYFILSKPTSTGFSVTFKSSFDGTELISREFRYTAIGYGTIQA